MSCAAGSKTNNAQNSNMNAHMHLPRQHWAQSPAFPADTLRRLKYIYIYINYINYALSFFFATMDSGGGPAVPTKQSNLN